MTAVEPNDSEVIRQMEMELAATKRRLRERQVLNDGLAIALYWANHGWLCPKCAHFVYLIWNRDDYAAPDVLKPVAQRTKPVITLHWVSSCADHKLLIQKISILKVRENLRLERENFDTNMQLNQRSSLWRA